MNKWMSVGLVSLVALLSVSLSSAEEMKGMRDKEPGMKKGMMMDGKKMGMMGPMMKMMEKSVVATSDGGIVVFAGNKITKYDKDLNLVKEIEVKTDMDAMQKEMSGMMKMCPMMNGEMKGMDESEKTSTDAVVEGPDTSDHSAHH